MQRRHWNAPERRGWKAFALLACQVVERDVSHALAAHLRDWVHCTQSQRGDAIPHRAPQARFLVLRERRELGEAFLEVKCRAVRTATTTRARSRYPQPDFFGNLGRNTLIGPGLAMLDMSVNKRFQITERVTLQFRTEMFNSLNHPNFAIPSARTVFTSTGPVGSAGRITSTLTSARQLQLGMKLVF